MGQPTIYKPSVYNGNGIYKNGAAGGGGGLSVLNNCSFTWFSSIKEISFDSLIEKQNLCIIFSWIKKADNITPLQWEDENGNGIGYVNVASNGSLLINNKQISSGYNLAINQPQQSIIIRENVFVRQETNTQVTNNIPYTNANIKKLKFRGAISRICLYNGQINEFATAQKIIDLRPQYQEGNSGFIDVVNGVFYSGGYSMP